MKTVLTVFAALLAVCHGLNVMVTMPNGKKVTVPVADPKKMTVGEFRKVLRGLLDSDDKPFARVVALCNPHRLVSIDPTPILPMRNDKTLYEQGVYTLLYDSIELPQSFFAFEDVASKQTLVLSGCEWSTPAEVLALADTPFRQFRNLNSHPAPPATGKNANAFDTVEQAENAAKKVQVVSNKFCSFTAQFTPRDHVTSVFPCTPDTTTVAELRVAVQNSILTDPRGSKLLAESAVLCKDKGTVGDCMLNDSQTISQAFGPNALDLVFPSPASFVRVLVGTEHYDVPACQAMTVAELQQQIVRRLGLKPGTNVTFQRAELAGETPVPINALYLHPFMFHARHSPVYMLRLHEFDKSDYVEEPTASTGSVVPDVGMIVTEGSKLFKDRRVLIAVVVLIVGVLLITVGIMTSSAAEDGYSVTEIKPVAAATQVDHLPAVNEPSLYEVGQRSSLPEVNQRPAEPTTAKPVDQSLFEVEPLPSIGEQAFEPAEASVPEPVVYPTPSPVVKSEVNIAAPDNPPLSPLEVDYVDPEKPKDEQ